MEYNKTGDNSKVSDKLIQEYHKVQYLIFPKNKNKNKEIFRTPLVNAVCLFHDLF